LTVRNRERPRRKRAGPKAIRSASGKRYGVRNLLNQVLERLIFVGDALFEGGNDCALERYVDTWKFDVQCPLETIQAVSWKEIARRFKTLNFIG
jgi:hypothetical protein